jgi:hypothetical protein
MTVNLPDASKFDPDDEISEAQPELKTLVQSFNTIATDYNLGLLTGVDSAGQVISVTQNLWENIIADTGNTTANSPTDALTIAGGTGISTSIAGDTITITNTGVGSDSITDIQGGDNISVTPGDSAGSTIINLDIDSDVQLSGNTIINNTNYATFESVFGYQFGRTGVSHLLQITLSDDPGIDAVYIDAQSDIDLVLRSRNAGLGVNCGITLNNTGAISLFGDSAIFSAPVRFQNLTTTQRNAIAAPWLAPGIVIFNTTDTKLQLYDGSSWINLH